MIRVTVEANNTSLLELLIYNDLTGDAHTGNYNVTAVEPSGARTFHVAGHARASGYGALVRLALSALDDLAEERPPLHLDETTTLTLTNGTCTVRKIFVPDAHGLGQHEYIQADMHADDAPGILRDAVTFWQRRLAAFPRSPRAPTWTRRLRDVQRALATLEGAP